MICSFFAYEFACKFFVVGLPCFSVRTGLLQVCAALVGNASGKVSDFLRQSGIDGVILSRIPGRVVGEKA